MFEALDRLLAVHPDCGCAVEGLENVLLTFRIECEHRPELSSRRRFIHRIDDGQGSTAMSLKLAQRINGPVLVIGDVHGQTDELLTVIDKARQFPDFDQRWIVFIGDLVDRGPDPRGAMDMLVALLQEHRRTTVVCGNHELAMAGALGLIPAPDYCKWGEQWIEFYDSETTFESYGAEFGNLDDLKSKVPPLHQQILANLPWSVEHPNYFFVHAGLDPNASFDMQLRILRSRDYSLNRPKWICSKSLVNSNGPADCPVPIVSGHVQVPQVKLSQHRILVDTTGGYEGDLSAVLLPEGHVISSGEDIQPSRDSDARPWWNFWSRAS